MAATILNDNLQNNSPKALDNKHGKLVSVSWQPYADVAEANATINIAYRHKGLTVIIQEISGVAEYWYRNGITDGDLVKKVALRFAVPGEDDTAFDIRSFNMNSQPFTMTSGFDAFKLDPVTRSFGLGDLTHTYNGTKFLLDDINQKGYLAVHLAGKSAGNVLTLLNATTGEVGYAAPAAGASTRFGVSGEDDTAAQTRGFDVNTHDFVIFSAATIAATKNLLQLSSTGAHTATASNGITLSITNTQHGFGDFLDINYGLFATVSGTSIGAAVGIRGEAHSGFSGSTGVQGSGNYRGVEGFAFSSGNAVGVYGIGTSAGVSGEANGGQGVRALNTASEGDGTGVGFGAFIQVPTSSFAYAEALMMTVIVPSPSFGATGLGVKMTFRLPTTTQFTQTSPYSNPPISNEITSEWLDATDLTRKSGLTITGVNNATTSVLLMLLGAGELTFPHGFSNFADDTAAAGGGIAIGQVYRTGSALKIRVS